MIHRQLRSHFVGNVHGIVLPLTLLIITVLSIIGMSIATLSIIYLRSSASTQDETVCSYAAEAAAVQIQYQLNKRQESADTSLSGTLPGYLFGETVEYDARLHPSKPQSLPSQRTITLTVYVPSKKQHRYTRSYTFEGNFVTGTIPPRFAYALYTGSPVTINYSDRYLSVRGGGIYCAGDITFTHNPLHIIKGGIFSKGAIRYTIPPSRKIHANVAETVPPGVHWEQLGVDNSYFPEIASLPGIIDFNRLGRIVMVEGDMDITEPFSVRGWGIILVRGAVHIDADIRTTDSFGSNALSILSQEGITVGPGASCIEAVLYAEKDIAFSSGPRYRVVGSLIASGAVEIPTHTNLDITYDNRFRPAHPERPVDAGFFLPVPSVYNITPE